MLQAEAHNELFWANYLLARLEYSREIYDLIYEYHAAHSSSWALAHGVGTGPGQVAAEIATRFNHVIASDNSGANLTAAMSRLADLSAAHKVCFANDPAEELPRRYPAERADSITVAGCMLLLDVKSAMVSFVTLLKPGGTIAIIFYGRPSFAEPEYAARCQPILDDILTTSYGKYINSGDPARQAAIRSVVEGIVSFLDTIKLDELAWEDVIRHKWNPDRPMCFFDPIVCDFELDLSLKVDEEEKVIEKIDLNFWAEDWDLEGVKHFVQTNLLVKQELNEGDEELNAKYTELELAMGGDEATRKITWPVVLILATKKDMWGHLYRQTSGHEAIRG